MSTRLCLFSCVVAGGLLGSGSIALAVPCTPGSFFETSAHYAASTYAIEVTAADFDNNGRTDFAIVGFAGNRLTVWMNQSSGFVQPLGNPVLPSPANIISADLNEDGLLDLVVSCFDSRIRVLRGVGDGTFVLMFESAVPIEPRGLTTGDFNEDDILDVAVASVSGLSIFLGQGAGGVGNGQFGVPTFFAGLSPWAGVAGGDFNSDGILDLAIANGTHNFVSIFPGVGAGGVGNGTFGPRVDLPVHGPQREMEAKDVTGDGVLDLVAAGVGGIMVLKGEGSGGAGNGQFTNLFFRGTSSNGVVVADFTDDDITDMIVTAPGSAAVLFFRGTGGGGFAEGESYPVQAGPVGIAAADFNLDHGLDVVVANTGPGTATMLHATCASPDPQPPVVLGFSPAGGRVSDHVTINGTGFGDATSVRFFDGVEAVIQSRTATEIGTVVPSGAVTGPITVENPQGTGTSSASFIVGHDPVVAAATPPQGKRGTPVVIDGDHFTGTTLVRFGAAGSAAFVVNSDDKITAVIDAAATTGPISVTTPVATGVSLFTFVVLPPDTFPRIVDVADVRNDQGGKVSLTWLRSDFDAPDVHEITGYRVWRRAPQATTLSAREAGMMRIETAGPSGSTLVEFWEPLATLPSAFLEGYAYVAPTTQDSLRNGNPYTAFFVQALTTDDVVFYNSAVDSGYSVDNLSPRTPAPLTATYTSSGVALRWGASPEADLGGYRLYRGSSANFVPGESNHIATVSDTGYFDPAGSTSNYYKLSVVDIHGNESYFTLVTPNGPVASLASLARADALPDHVRLSWDASANPGLLATLYRRAGSSDWARMSGLSADAGGRMTYEDADVEAGGRYGYRLGVMDAGIERFVGEGWVDLPRFTVAFASIRPNPAVSGAFAVEMTLAGASRATLELLDVTGRLVGTRDIAGASAGRHTARFDLDAGLAPGLYFMRLTQEDRRVTAKVAVLGR